MDNKDEEMRKWKTFSCNVCKKKFDRYKVIGDENNEMLFCKNCFEKSEFSTHPFATNMWAPGSWGDKMLKEVVSGDGQKEDNEL